MVRSWVAVPAALLALVVMAGCQPLERSQGDGAAVSAGAATADGAMVQTLPALLELAAVPAQEWQDDPRLAHVAVELDVRDPGRRWTAAGLEYVAPGGDRLLSLFLDGDGLRQEQVSFETLGLAPIPAAALEQLPPFPDVALAPAELVDAAGDALERCGIDATTVSEVLYTTGAPATWDGERWAQPPVWRAALIGEDGASAVVDPATGEPGSSAAC